MKLFLDTNKYLSRPVFSDRNVVTISLMGSISKAPVRNLKVWVLELIFCSKFLIFYLNFSSLEMYRRKNYQKSVGASTNKFEKHGYWSTHSTHTNGVPVLQQQVLFSQLRIIWNLPYVLKDPGNEENGHWPYPFKYLRTACLRRNRMKRPKAGTPQWVSNDGCKLLSYNPNPVKNHPIFFFFLKVFGKLTVTKEVFW